MVEFEVGDGTVTTTEDHEFWNVTDDAWQETQHIDAGDLLLTADGATVEAGTLLWETAHVAPAFDLTIDEIHTYHVTAGDESVLVHNCSPEEAQRVLDEFENDASVIDRVGDGAARSGAASNIDVNGTQLQSEYRSFSGENTIEGTVNPPDDPVFSPTINENNQTPAAFDAEYKVLEQVASDIDEALGVDLRVTFNPDGTRVSFPEAVGEIFLTTRSVPGRACNSCAMVFDEFRQRYPNVELVPEDLELVAN